MELATPTAPATPEQLEQILYRAAWSGAPPQTPQETERCDHDMIKRYCGWCNPGETP